MCIRVLRSGCVRCRAFVIARSACVRPQTLRCQPTASYQGLHVPHGAVKACGKAGLIAELPCLKKYLIGQCTSSDKGRSCSCCSRTWLASSRRPKLISLALSRSLVLSFEIRDRTCGRVRNPRSGVGQIKHSTEDLGLAKLQCAGVFSSGPTGRKSRSGSTSKCPTGPGTGASLSASGGCILDRLCLRSGVCVSIALRFNCVCVLSVCVLIAFAFAF